MHSVKLTRRSSGWRQAGFSILLLASSLSYGSCLGAKTPEPIIIVKPCSLPMFPVEPKIGSEFVAKDGGVCMSENAGRALIIYLHRVRAWMQQAAVCVKVRDAGALVAPAARDASLKVQ